VAYRPVDGQVSQNEQRDNGCCLAMAGKHINNTRAIARQLIGKRVPAATVEVLLNYNNGNAIFCVVRVEVL
jgi:hypothetical protein